MIPFVNHLAAAVGAVHSGLCDVVLAYHGAYRLPWNTGSAAKDPFRRGASLGGSAGVPPPESVAAAAGYTAWASRYMHEFGVPREHFGYVAINDRSNAARNPAAAMREPITMDDYLAARMIRWPLCLLRHGRRRRRRRRVHHHHRGAGADLPLPPVLVNAVALGHGRQERRGPVARASGATAST